MRKIWILDFCSGKVIMVNISEEKEKELERIGVEEFLTKYEETLGIRTKDCHYMVTDDAFLYEVENL